MKADVIVLGAGIVGVSTALHLQMQGRSVVLVDRKVPGEGTSYGNAGLIERSSVIPYAFPRNLAALAKYALNRSSDVRYDPLYLPRIAPFLFSYWRNSSPKKLAVAARAMLPLVEASVSEHDALVEAAGAAHLIREKGWIAAYKTPARFETAVAQAKALASYRLSYDVLSPKDFAALEPSFRTGEGGIAGAVHWRDPKTVTDPGELTKQYARLFESRGGVVATGDAATLAPAADGWTVTASTGQLSAREAVVALGPQSGLVFRRFGYRIPLAVKRGYHRHYRLEAGHSLGHSVVDEEAGYVLAPMSRGVRLTTGIEFADPKAPAMTVQISRDERIARALLPLGEAVEETPWLGLRPCLPDMRPVIGAAPRHPGLWFNFGHAHHGLTLGPVTGRLLAAMMTGGELPTDPEPYAPSRFG